VAELQQRGHKFVLLVIGLPPQIWDLKRFYIMLYYGVYIYSTIYIYIMWLYVIYYCMWLCHIVSCCLCFDNFWWWLGVSSLKRLCIKSQTCKGAVAPNISKQSIVSRLTSLSSL
jgi:hypothetical protein